MRVDIPLFKNVLTQRAKRFLMPKRLTTAASAIDATISKQKQKKKKIRVGMRPGMLRLRVADLAQRTTLTISNKQMKHVVTIVNSLEESGLLIKGVIFNATSSLH